jgi:glutathione peroxidase
MKTAAKIFIAVVAVTVTTWACSSSKIQGNMSTRQNMLKSVYPALTSITRFFGVNSRVVLSEEKKAPVVSLYDIPFETISGEPASFAAYKGKKIVIVNTASDCGYTGQYEELQSLFAQAKGEIMVVGFPANDFKEQEKGSNEQIASFCKKNYGVAFPIAAKASVVKGNNQHPVFAWLSDPSKNGWNKEAPAWNFSKYIIDEEGKLIGYFDPGVSPLGKDFLKALNISTP